jgi:hypothetical protein
MSSSPYREIGAGSASSSSSRQYESRRIRARAPLSPISTNTINTNTNSTTDTNAVSVQRMCSNVGKHPSPSSSSCGGIKEWYQKKLDAIDLLYELEEEGENEKEEQSHKRVNNENEKEKENDSREGEADAEKEEEEAEGPLAKKPRTASVEPNTTNAVHIQEADSNQGKKESSSSDHNQLGSKKVSIE